MAISNDIIEKMIEKRGEQHAKIKLVFDYGYTPAQAEKAVSDLINKVPPKYTPELIEKIIEFKELLVSIADLPHSGSHEDENGLEVYESGIVYKTMYRDRDGDSYYGELGITWEELNKPDVVEYFRKKFKDQNDEYIAAQKKKKEEEEVAREKQKNSPEYKQWLELNKQFGRNW